MKYEVLLFYMADNVVVGGSHNAMLYICKNRKILGYSYINNDFANHKLKKKELYDLQWFMFSAGWGVTLDTKITKNVLFKLSNKELMTLIL